jgi:GLPGLI family protein
MKVLIILFFAFTHLFSQKTDYSIYYKFTYAKDTVALSSYSTPVYFLLHKNGSDSKFLSFGQYLVDSSEYAIIGDLDPALHTQEIVYKVMKGMDPRAYSSFNLMVAKDFKTQIQYFSIHTVGGYYICKKDLTIEWQFHNEKDTIQGLEVFKATTHIGGRDWVCWYAPSIAIKDGPYKFYDLPGLIVKAYDTDKRYIFELFKIQNPFYKYMNLLYKKNIVYVDCDYIKKFMHNFQKNPSAPNLLTNQGELVNKLKNDNLTRFDYLIEK